LLGVALACAAAVYAQWMPLMQLVRWLNPSVVWFVDVPPGVRAAALTIDDSPRGDGSSTEAILDMLREAGVRATFFVISGQVRTERHRALLRRMVAEGHELANHGRAEERAILLSDDEYARSLRVCDAFLAFEETAQSKIFDNRAFGYHKVTVERPLRIRGIDAGRVYGHRDIGQSACPGTNLYGEVLSLRGV
jgi:hypothetical protein